MKRGRGRPPSRNPRGRLRALRFDDTEDREVEAALAVEGKEFSEWARPVIVGAARKSIDKARKR